MSICDDKDREERDAKQHDAEQSTLPLTISPAQLNAMNRRFWSQDPAETQQDSCDSKDACDVTPPGGEEVVKALKKEPGVENPWAVAWAMKSKGQI